MTPFSEWEGLDDGGAPEGQELTPYDRVEAMLVGAGAYMGVCYGNVRQKFEVAQWVLPGGALLLVKRYLDGSVEVYAPIEPGEVEQEVHSRIRGG